MAGTYFNKRRKLSILDKDLGSSDVISRFANESFRQRSFRKRLWSVRKRVEVSSQTFRSQFANVINIDMSTYVLTVQCLNYWV